MNSGILAATWLCMVLGQAQAGPETIHSSSRNHRVPVNVPAGLRADIARMLLYTSTDQGRNWTQAATITPDKDAFLFYAPSDGTYWLRVAQINRAGMQSPSDKELMVGQPNLIMVIDTMKPIIRSIKGQRDGDDVYVKWDVQEDNPDPAGMRLEYQVKDAVNGGWTPIPLPAATLQGQAKFRATSNQALVIRLTVSDLAKNQSYAEDVVAGTIAAAAYNPPTAAVQPPPSVPERTLPVDIAIPKQPSGPMNVNALPPPPNVDPPPYKVLSPGGNSVAPPLPPREVIPGDKFIADSNVPPPPPKKAMPIEPVTPPPPSGVQPPPVDAPQVPVKSAVPARKPLPELMYLNRHQVLLQYELKRVGPSGIGGIEGWLTKHDGDTWEPYAEVKDNNIEAVQGRQERNFDFRDKDDAPFPDGIYGLILVVKNRAGRGRNPRPGDVPDMRVEIDTKIPHAKLGKPVADPAHPDQVLFRWFAEDKNLSGAPVNLEYAEKIDGEWLPIQLNLENKGRYTNEKFSGDFSWKVPANFPVQVFLRLRVRDKAGNESVAASRQPEYLDLTEPEGQIIGVQTK